MSLTDERRGPRAQVAAVLRVHQSRTFHLDGYPDTYEVCSEDRQLWPCTTVKAIDDAQCPHCHGLGWVVEPEMQCGDYEHHCGEGCAAPVQVACTCTRPAPAPTTDEEPF